MSKAIQIVSFSCEKIPLIKYNNSKVEEAINIANEYLEKKEREYRNE